MRSAIGNSLLMSIVVIIVSAVVLIFVSVLSYSKAYRVKNGIIEIIEKYGRYENNDYVHEEIASYLNQVGYQLGDCNTNKVSNNIASKEDTRGYKYCIEAEYEGIDAESNTHTGYRKYKVTTYVEFNFPIVGSISPIAVSGETKILGRNYDNMN